jgi:hypothetical protein
MQPTAEIKNNMAHSSIVIRTSRSYFLNIFLLAINSWRELSLSHFYATIICLGTEVADRPVILLKRHRQSKDRFSDDFVEKGHDISC